MATATKKAATKRGAKATAEPTAEPRPSLAQIGRDASREARRKVLLSELRRQKWNMTAVAKLLGMSNTSNVLRATLPPSSAVRCALRGNGGARENHH